jgi:hypothetical protein
LEFQPFFDGVIMISKITVTVAFLLLSFASADDKWMESGQNGVFPNEMYFTGLGTSAQSKELAAQNAQLAVKRQISVDVKSSILNEQSSSTLNGEDAYAVDHFESRARLTTEGDIQGVQVVKQGQKKGVFFALAALDKENFESNLRVQILELKADLSQSIEGAKLDISQNKLGKAMTGLLAARLMILDLLEKRTLLSAVAIVGGAESLNYSEADLDVLYSQIVSSLELKNISGDNQVFMMEKPSSEAVVFKVTANEEIVAGLLIAVYDEDKKLIDELYSDKEGLVRFDLGKKGDLAVGHHEYRVSLKLKVKSNYRKLLRAQDKEFRYEVESKPCYVQVNVDGDSEMKAMIEKKLLKYDIQHLEVASKVLNVKVVGAETGRTQGVSAARSFVKTEVEVSFDLKNTQGKSLYAFQKSANGLGNSFGKSVLKAVSNLKISKGIKSVSALSCKVKN